MFLADETCIVSIESSLLLRKEGKAKLDVLFFLLLQLESVPSVAVEPIWERKTGRVDGSRAGPRP